MSPDKVTAVATSVIAISVIGFIGFQIYNDPKNIEARCTATYKKQIKDVSEYYLERGITMRYRDCLMEARR